MNKMIHVKMFYDDYEKYFGDGFYPILEENEKYTSIIISFQYKNDNWIQISQDEINGLDRDVGKELLDFLNNEGNEEGKIIKNSYGYILYKK